MGVNVSDQICHVTIYIHNHPLTEAGKQAERLHFKISSPFNIVTATCAESHPGQFTQWIQVSKVVIPDRMSIHILPKVASSNALFQNFWRLVFLRIKKIVSIISCSIFYVLYKEMKSVWSQPKLQSKQLSLAMHLLLAYFFEHVHCLSNIEFPCPQPSQVVTITCVWFIWNVFDCIFEPLKGSSLLATQLVWIQVAAHFEEELGQHNFCAAVVGYSYNTGQQLSTFWEGNQH